MSCCFLNDWLLTSFWSVRIPPVKADASDAMIEVHTKLSEFVRSVDKVYMFAANATSTRRTIEHQLARDFGLEVGSNTSVVLPFSVVAFLFVQHRTVGDGPKRCVGVAKPGHAALLGTPSGLGDLAEQAVGELLDEIVRFMKRLDSHARPRVPAVTQLLSTPTVQALEAFQGWLAGWDLQL